jgi:hypothetical protein
MQKAQGWNEDIFAAIRGRHANFKNGQASTREIGAVALLFLTVAVSSLTVSSAQATPRDSEGQTVHDLPRRFSAAQVQPEEIE